MRFWYLWIKRIEDVLVIVEVDGAVFVHQLRLIFMFLHTKHLSLMDEQKSHSGSYKSSFR